MEESKPANTADMPEKNLMKAPSPRDVLLRDPLTELTRKERRSLLIASALGVVFVEGGFVPSKIATFGIEFTETDQRSLLIVVSIVVIYFLAGFLLYAASDFINWRGAWVDAFGAAVEESEARPPRKLLRLEDFEEEEDPWEELDRKNHAMYVENWTREMDKNMKYFRLTGPISFLRMFFEFFLPILIGGYAVYALWSGLPTN